MSDLLNVFGGAIALGLYLAFVLSEPMRRAAPADEPDPPRPLPVAVVRKR